MHKKLKKSARNKIIATIMDFTKIYGIHKNSTIFMNISIKAQKESELKWLGQKIDIQNVTGNLQTKITSITMLSVQCGDEACT